MANEQDRSGSLTASVGEQLREKAESDLASEEDRRAAARREAGLERRKREEREAALRHSGGERRPRPRRGYDESAPSGWLLAGLATMALGAACGVRGKQLLFGAGALLLLARLLFGVTRRAEQDRLLAANAATAR